jgi:23S rRNA pseudouridine2605 synthase
VRPRAGEHVTIALNKPLGMVTTMHDERGRPCIGDLLRTELRSGTTKTPRLFPIGRLDAQTTGLLLCTSDGELSRRLSHPSFEVPRRYRVTVKGTPSDAALRSLDAGKLQRRADDVAQFEMTLTAGKNREIRRRCAHHGLRVIGLERVSYGPIALAGLAPGRHRALTIAQVQALRRAVKEGPS